MNTINKSRKQPPASYIIWRRPDTETGRSATGHAVRWLSAEAIKAEPDRRRLERWWKRTGAEIDRKLNRAACCKANQLINSSRN
jgi:hypothetical protein